MRVETITHSNIRCQDRHRFDQPTDHRRQLDIATDFDHHTMLRMVLALDPPLRQLQAGLTQSLQRIGPLVMLNTNLRNPRPANAGR